MHLQLHLVNLRVANSVSLRLLQPSSFHEVERGRLPLESAPFPLAQFESCGGLAPVH